MKWQKLEKGVSFMDIITEQISKGPAIAALVDGFKYAYDKRNPHVVEFTSDDGKVFRVKITSLEYEDESGERVLFGGFLLGNVMHVKISGYYDASTQTGYFTR